MLLVWDLKRPERFLYIFLKSNFRSWLVLGSYALMFFAVVSGVWLLLGIAVQVDADHRPLLPTLGILPNPMHIKARSIMRSEAN